MSILVLATLLTLCSPSVSDQKDVKVADTKFWLVNGFMIGATIYDIESTYKFLDSCPPEYKCTEANPVMRSFVNRGRVSVYGIHSAINLVAGYASYEMKKKGRDYWWILPVALGIVHSTAGTYNFSMALSWK